MGWYNTVADRAGDNGDGVTKESYFVTPAPYRYFQHCSLSTVPNQKFIAPGD